MTSLALEEYKLVLTHSTGRVVLPFSTFLHHHVAVLKAVEENDLTPARLRKIAAADDAIADVHFELESAWAAKQKAMLAKGRP